MVCRPPVRRARPAPPRRASRSPPTTSGGSPSAARRARAARVMRERAQRPIRVVRATAPARADGSISSASGARPSSAANPARDARSSQSNASFGRPRTDEPQHHRRRLGRMQTLGQRTPATDFRALPPLRALSTASSKHAEILELRCGRASPGPTPPASTGRIVGAARLGPETASREPRPNAIVSYVPRHRRSRPNQLVRPARDDLGAPRRWQPICAAKLAEAPTTYSGSCSADVAAKRCGRGLGEPVAVSGRQPRHEVLRARSPRSGPSLASYVSHERLGSETGEARGDLRRVRPPPRARSSRPRRTAAACSGPARTRSSACQRRAGLGQSAIGRRSGLSLHRAGARRATRTRPRRRSSPAASGSRASANTRSRSWPA